MIKFCNYVWGPAVSNSEEPRGLVRPNPRGRRVGLPGYSVPCCTPHIARSLRSPVLFLAVVKATTAVAKGVGIQKPVAVVAAMACARLGQYAS